MTRQKVLIFVISLTHAKQRRKFIRQQMQQYGLEFSFFDALDGEQLDAEFLSRFRVAEGEKQLNRGLSRGELGCIFSHYKLLRQIEKAGLPQTIVLEDDVGLNAEFADLVHHLAELSDGWEMLQFGYWPRDWQQEPIILRAVHPLSLWQKKRIALAGKKHYIGPLIDYIEATHGYAVSHKGASKLRATIERKRVLPFDDFLNSNNDLIIRHAVVPNLVQQISSQGIEQHIHKGREEVRQVTEGYASNWRRGLGLFMEKIPIVSPVWTFMLNLRRRVRKTYRVILRRPGHKITS